MAQISIDESLMGFKDTSDMERAIIKMQKQLNWALNNLDIANTSTSLASGSFTTADEKTVTVINGFVTEII